jgi:hypothetical protein
MLTDIDTDNITDNHDEVAEPKPWLAYAKKKVTYGYAGHNKVADENTKTVLNIDGIKFNIVIGENTYETPIPNTLITTCCAAAVSGSDDFEHYATLIATKAGEKFLSLSGKGKQGFKYYSQWDFISVKSCSLHDRLLCVPAFNSNNRSPLVLYVPVGMVSHDDYEKKVIPNGVPNRLLPSSITFTTPVLVQPELGQIESAVNKRNLRRK